MILELEFDEANEAHLTRHGVSLVEVKQVFMNSADIRRNRKNRAATHPARGRTNGGRRILVAFVDRGQGRVRPITAWEIGT